MKNAKIDASLSQGFSGTHVRNYLNIFVDCPCEDYTWDKQQLFFTETKTVADIYKDFTKVIEIGIRQFYSRYDRFIDYGRYFYSEQIHYGYFCKKCGEFVNLLTLRDEEIGMQRFVDGLKYIKVI